VSDEFSPLGFELEEGIDIASLVKDSVGGLEFGGGLEAVAVAHLRCVLERTALWRSVFDSIFKEL